MRLSTICSSLMNSDRWRILPEVLQMVTTHYVQEASRGTVSPKDVGWPLGHPLLPKEPPLHLLLLRSSKGSQLPLEWVSSSKCKALFDLLL